MQKLLSQIHIVYNQYGEPSPAKHESEKKAFD